MALVLSLTQTQFIPNECLSVFDHHTNTGFLLARFCPLCEGWRWHMGGTANNSVPVGLSNFHVSLKNFVTSGICSSVLVVYQVFLTRIFRLFRFRLAASVYLFIYGSTAKSRDH